MHNDYHCCAICDDKTNRVSQYEDWQAKHSLCSFCELDLRRDYDLRHHNVITLMAWMRKEKPEQVIAILDELGFRKCSEPNSVDELYDEIKAKAEGG